MSRHADLNQIVTNMGIRAEQLTIPQNILLS